MACLYMRAGQDDVTDVDCRAVARKDASRPSLRAHEAIHVCHCPSL